jgi:DNA gyrase subunit A
MVLARPERTILTVCENGYGKRTKLSEYRKQSRGGKGIINIRTTDRNGSVVAMKAVRDDDELMLITQQGKLVRISVKSISVVGRATQGVRVMALNDEDTLVAITRVVKDNGNDKVIADGNDNGKTVADGKAVASDKNAKKNSAGKANADAEEKPAPDDQDVQDGPPAEPADQATDLADEATEPEDREDG